MIDLEASLVEQRTGQSAEGCVKTVSDLARYRELLDRVQPTLIIETGTFSGKSALWFSQWAPVLTVDTSPQVDEDTMRAGQAAELGHVVEFLVGHSVGGVVGYRVMQVLACAPFGNRVFVSLDSDHSSMHVLAEMRAYGPLVGVGSYMVVEDTIVRWCPWEMQPEGPYAGSPLDAVERHLATQQADGTLAKFALDLDIEDRYPTTQFPSGWLKRVG